MQIFLCTPRSCNLQHPQTLVSAWESSCWKLTRLTLPGLSPWGLPAAQEVQNGEEKQSKRDWRQLQALLWESCMEHYLGVSRTTPGCFVCKFDAKTRGLQRQWLISSPSLAHPAADKAAALAQRRARAGNVPTSAGVCSPGIAVALQVFPSLGQSPHGFTVWVLPA